MCMEARATIGARGTGQTLANIKYYKGLGICKKPTWILLYLLNKNFSWTCCWEAMYTYNIVQTVYLNSNHV